MQTKGMQETFQSVHTQNDCKCHISKYKVPKNQAKEIRILQRSFKTIIKKDSTQLIMSKTQSPQSQIRSGIRDRT
jgi:hypothetical protein